MRRKELGMRGFGTPTMNDEANVKKECEFNSVGIVKGGSVLDVTATPDSFSMIFCKLVDE